MSTILINCVSYSSFSLPLGLFATSFCVPSSWILSVAINGELAGRIMYGCKHKSNLGQPSSEDPHTVSINSKTLFHKSFYQSFGAYDIDSRKLKKKDIIDRCRLLSTTPSLLNSPY